MACSKYEILLSMMRSKKTEHHDHVEIKIVSVVTCLINITTLQAQILLKFKCQLKLNWLSKLLEMYMKLIYT